MIWSTLLLYEKDASLQSEYLDPEVLFAFVSKGGEALIKKQCYPGIL